MRLKIYADFLARVSQDLCIRRGYLSGDRLGYAGKTYSIDLKFCTCMYICRICKIRNCINSKMTTICQKIKNKVVVLVGIIFFNNNLNRA